MGDLITVAKAGQVHTLWNEAQRSSQLTYMACVHLTAHESTPPLMVSSVRECSTIEHGTHVEVLAGGRCGGAGGQASNPSHGSKVRRALLLQSSKCRTQSIGTHGRNGRSYCWRSEVQHDHHHQRHRRHDRHDTLAGEAGRAAFSGWCSTRCPPTRRCSSRPRTGELSELQGGVEDNGIGGDDDDDVDDDDDDDDG
jgi:hypothetical protein